MSDHRAGLQTGADQVNDMCVMRQSADVPARLTLLTDAGCIESENGRQLPGVQDVQGPQTQNQSAFSYHISPAHRLDRERKNRPKRSAPQYREDSSDEADFEQRSSKRKKSRQRSAHPQHARSTSPDKAERALSSKRTLTSFVALTRLTLPKKYSLLDQTPLYSDKVDLSNAWLQTRPCTGLATRSSKYLNLQCAACKTRSATVGGCRFKDIRKFLSNPFHDFTDSYVLADEEFSATPLSTEGTPVFSTLGTCEQALSQLHCVKASYIETLITERHHEQAGDILRRQRDQNTRAVCDGCSTTIFSGHWICYCCARELCLDCYSEWNDNEDMIVKYLHLNFCRSMAGRGKLLHTKRQMLPYTRFAPGEIDCLLEALNKLPRSDTSGDNHKTLETIEPTEGAPYVVGDIDDVNLSTFERHWATGEPLLLSGFAQRFSLKWTPAYFESHFGQEQTELVDVVSRICQMSTVGSFFRGLESGSMTSFKLNDWPEVSDFAEAMPELFEDFENALPFPIYTQRKGFMNLAAWFPAEYLPPDLGPKLYCAGASSDGAGQKGTTVLHMDMTDAVNLMTWAGPPPSNRPGCAVWDVFRQRDSAVLKDYLLAKFRRANPGAHMDDPIRRAQFYLDIEDLAILNTDHGVMSKRIYQNPGQAVFIPAGCAHQVCNLTPCIKVACDFVSPQNVQRCSSITTADRNLAALAKREDVLQLKNVIHFAVLGLMNWLGLLRPENSARLAENVESSALTAHADRSPKLTRKKTKPAKPERETNKRVPKRKRMGPSTTEIPRMVPLELQDNQLSRSRNCLASESTETPSKPKRTLSNSDTSSPLTDFSSVSEPGDYASDCSAGVPVHYNTNPDYSEDELDHVSQTQDARDLAGSKGALVSSTSETQDPARATNQTLGSASHSINLVDNIRELGAKATENGTSMDSLTQMTSVDQRDMIHTSSLGEGPNEGRDADEELSRMSTFNAPKSNDTQDARTIDGSLDTAPSAATSG